jgi:hypothetical protein
MKNASVPLSTAAMIISNIANDAGERTADRACANPRRGAGALGCHRGTCHR